MKLPGQYLTTADGRTWVCLDSAITHYAELAKQNEPGARAAERFLRSMLALAQEWQQK